MFVKGLGRNEHYLQRTFHRCFLQSFGSFGKAVSEKKIFRNRPTRNKNCLWWPCLLTDPDEISNLYRGPSIDASYQVSIHLAKSGVKQISPKFTGPGSVSTRNLLVLNIRMEEIKFVEHKINLPL